MLALLVYFYGNGVLASHDIEAALSQNIQFRRIFGDVYPDVRSFQLFRRKNRRVIIECLAKALATPTHVPRDRWYQFLPKIEPNGQVEWLKTAESLVDLAVIMDTEE